MVAKIGRPKGTRKYRAKAFEDGCAGYFASISYTVPLTRKEPVIDEDGYPELDSYGHIQFRYVPVIAADGQEAMNTCWTEPPSIQGLCLYLGIDASTFSRYMKPDPDDPESVRLAQAAATAKARVETYLIARLEDKGAANGAKFNLQHNFGWMERKAEEPIAGAGQKAEESLKGLSMEEKLRMLREAGVDMSKWE